MSDRPTSTEAMPRPGARRFAALATAASPEQIAVLVAFRIAFVIVAALAAVACGLGNVVTLPSGLPKFLFDHQDLQTLAVLLPLLGLPALMPLPTLGVALPRPLIGSRWTAVGCAVFVFAAAIAGTYWVFDDYSIVRDQMMVDFDVAIFRHGNLMAPLPPEWRPFGGAMLPKFGVSIAANAAWVSAYLPGNAAFRALVASIAAPEFANPVLAVIAVWMTWSLARVIWPDRRDAAVVAVLLLATSTQMLFMAMTNFANTGHLALNLVWLRLFLRDDVKGYLGAAVAGAVAIGWHQFAFHPLFAAPFVFDLLRRRRGAGIAFVAFYAATLLVWISYDRFAASLSGFALGIGAGSGLGYFADVTRKLLVDQSASGVVFMAMNLLRFVVWQNPITLVLFIAALRARDGLPRPLRLALQGLLLTLVTMQILQPFQGLGWGYRYIHGFIGFVCLIAAHAWTKLVDREGDDAAVAAPMVAATAFALLFALPTQAGEVRRYIAPWIAAQHVITTSGRDVVIVDERGLFNADELVRNDPFLRSRPVTMTIAPLTVDAIAGLCRLGKSVALFDTGSQAAGPLTVAPADTFAETAEILPLRAAIMALPCYAPLPAKP